MNNVIGNFEISDEAACDPAVAPSLAFDDSNQGPQEVNPGAFIIEYLHDLMDRAEYADICKLAESLLENYPDSYLVREIIGSCHLHQGNHMEAIADLITAKDKLQQHAEQSAVDWRHYFVICNKLGVAYKELGLFDQSEHWLNEAKASEFVKSDVFNNLGTLELERGNTSLAKSYFVRSFQANPKNRQAIWNLHSTAACLDEAIVYLKSLLEADPLDENVILYLAHYLSRQGDTGHFDKICYNGIKDNPVYDSIRFLHEHAGDAKLFFNRWELFSYVTELSVKSRAFYEFGVWRGTSFNYLASHFDHAFGFDTFTGLPERWGKIPMGTYSNEGGLPSIQKGELVVGNFADTLPAFFAEKGRLAGLVNFDADLYSSTLCALDHLVGWMDDKTILVFDEFIINKTWRDDEYKALVEICSRERVRFQIIAYSLFTKQVACRLKFS